MPCPSRAAPTPLVPAQVDLQRARLPQTRAKGEYEMENTIKVLQHKESKLSACRQSFKEHEALVYHQLTNLIRDTVWLKSYLSGAGGRNCCVAAACHVRKHAAGALQGLCQALLAGVWPATVLRAAGSTQVADGHSPSSPLLQPCCAWRWRRSRRPTWRWARCGRQRCRRPAAWRLPPWPPPSPPRQRPSLRAATARHRSCSRCAWAGD